MGWRPFCDLTGDELAATDVHELTVALDGDTFREFMVGARPADELLDQLGRLLVDGVAARVGPDEPLDPGPLHEPNDTGPDEGYGVDSPTPADAVDDEAAVDESAEEQPTAVQPVESSQVTTAPTPDDSGESAGNRIPADVAAPASKVGEAERGQATDATVRRWTRDHHVVDLAPRKAVPSWVRAEYERLGGQPPDYRCRALARREGVKPIAPKVDPAVAMPDTIATWCVRNGVEDRLPPSTAGRAEYRAAWLVEHPEPPPADPVAAGQDPSAPGDRAGRSPSPGAEAVNGKALPEQPTPASVRPAVEPVGDGTAEPDSRPEQLEKADELASEGKTPRQIMAATGVWLREARAAVRKAAQR